MDPNKPKRDHYKITVPVYVPPTDDEDESVGYTAPEFLAMNRDWVPLDEDTYKGFRHVKEQNAKMNGEGRLLPAATQYEDSMRRWIQANRKDREALPGGFKSLMDAWNAHVAIDPPRGDWGDAGGSNPEWPRKEGRGNPASMTSAQENYWWEKNPRGITENDDGDAAQQVQARRPPQREPTQQRDMTPRKAYSRSTNKTYTFVDGEVVNEENGDTRGRAASR